MTRKYHNPKKKKRKKKKKKKKKNRYWAMCATDLTRRGASVWCVWGLTRRLAVPDQREM